MKRKVIVATDSAANLPSSLIKQYGIAVIPLWVKMETRFYRDGIDIQPLEFFQRLRERVREVGTSQPAPGEWLEFYRRLQDQAEAIVSVHVTSRYSGVVDAARAAAAELAPFPIEVVDTGTIAMAEGFVALAAARAAEAGASLSEVMERVRDLTPRVDLIAALETIEYAVRGGRMATAAHLLSSLLRIKPLVRVQGNEVNIFSKTRTRAKALRTLLDELAERVGDMPLHVAVLYTDALEEAQRLQDEVVTHFRCEEVYLEVATPVLGVHAGPGAVGLAFYAGE
jgi:DegV family protein with EDD domain